MNGLTPGPRLFVDEPLLVWTVIASLFVGNALLLLLNVPLVGLWTRLLAIPYQVLAAMIFTFLIIGSYAINNSILDVYLMLFFGVVGLVFRRLHVPLAPLVLTLILGPLIESALRQSLQISRGEFSIFFTRPISLTLLLLAAVVVLSSVLGSRLRPKAKSALPSDAEA